MKDILKTKVIIPSHEEDPLQVFYLHTYLELFLLQNLQGFLLKGFLRNKTSFMVRVFIWSLPLNVAIVLILLKYTRKLSSSNENTNELIVTKIKLDIYIYIHC